MQRGLLPPHSNFGAQKGGGGLHWRELGGVGWLDTVTFALGIQYLVVPGAEPPEDVLLELDDPDAQRLLMGDDVWGAVPNVKVVFWDM